MHTICERRAIARKYYFRWICTEGHCIERERQKKTIIVCVSNVHMQCILYGAHQAVQTLSPSNTFPVFYLGFSFFFLYRYIANKNHCTFKIECWINANVAWIFSLAAIVKIWKWNEMKRNGMDKTICRKYQRQRQRQRDETTMMNGEWWNDRFVVCLPALCVHLCVCVHLYVVYVRMRGIMKCHGQGQNFKN